MTAKADYEEAKAKARRANELAAGSTSPYFHRQLAKAEAALLVATEVYLQEVLRERAALLWVDSIGQRGPQSP